MTAEQQVGLQYYYIRFQEINTIIMHNKIFKIWTIHNLISNL